MTTPAGPHPQVITEVSWSTDPDDTPVWVDLDDPAKPAVTRHPVERLSTSRGRSYEQDQAEVGRLVLGLDNSAGDFTPGNTSGRYYPNVDLDKRIRVRIRPPAPYDTTVYPLFDGHIEELPSDVAEGGFATGTAQLTATDYLGALGGIELLSAYDHEVLATAPLGFYPLSEAASSSTVGNMAVTSATSGVLTYRNVAGGSYKLGGNALLPADPASSLELSPHTYELVPGATLTDGGWQVEFGGGSTPPYLPSTGGWTFEITAAVSAATTLQYGYSLLEQAGADKGVHAQVQVRSGDISVAVGGATGSPSASLVVVTNVFADGAVHHLAVTLSTDRKTITVYVDGTARGSSTAGAAATVTGAAAYLSVGGGYRPGSGAGLWVVGRIGKVAFYDRPLTAAEIARHHQARTGFSGEASGARQSRILDYAGFPASRRNIDAGQSVCGPLLSAGTDALPLLQKVQRTESGFVLMNAAGTYTFLGRARTRNTVSRVTLGGDALPYDGSGIRFGFDRSRMKNYIKATRPNGPTIVVQDPVSIRKHRRRTASITYEVSTDAELRDAASWDLLQYAYPRVRLSSISLDPFTSPALWPWALGLECGDRITLINFPSYAPASTLDFIVQRIAHDATIVRGWKTTLQLSPVLPASLRADGDPSALTKLDAGLVVAY